MIISDLQHIEFATENRVQASGGRRRPWHKGCNSKAKIVPENFALDIKTSTDTLIFEGQFSDSDFNFPSECF